MTVVRIADVSEGSQLSGDSSPAIAVGRALQILDALIGEDDAMSLSDLARRVALPKSTAFRIINQLTESGYLTREGRRYQLSAHVFRLGSSVPIPNSLPLRDMAAPHMAGLFQHTGFGVNLAVLDHVTEVLYIDRIRGPRILMAPNKIGATMPALVTALGKVIIAYSDDQTIREALRRPWPRRSPYTVMAPGLMTEQLRKARDVGVAYDRQESVIGLTCVAAPVLGEDGRPIAAVSACGPAGRFSPESAAQLTLRAARLISNDLKREAALRHMGST